MWLILPVGHDQGVRRFPWVTAAIIATCLALQIHRSLFGAAESELAAIMEERASIEREVVLEHRRAEMAKMMADVQGSAANIEEKMKAMRRGTDGMVAAFRSGELTGKDDPRYLKWLATRDREESLRRSDLAERFAYRPAQGLSLGLVTAAFVHGGWLHLIGNMLFLYLVGCNLEDRWGRGVFAGLFFAGAAVSALAFGMWHHQAGAAVIGASGAVAAGMGAFLICFHQAKIKLLLLSLYRAPFVFEAYAFWALPAWFLSQALNAWFEAYGASGVAYSAHVGGFAFGLCVATGLKLTRIESRYLLPATAKGVEWQEDGEFLRALDLVKADDRRGALPLLQAVVKRNPRHEGAWQQLARLALLDDDAHLAGNALANFVACLPHSRIRDAVTFIRETHALEKRLALSDRTLATLLRAAAEDDAPLALTIARRLAKEFPQSIYLPGAMWEVAAVQEKAGQPALAISTLNQLIQRFPSDPFASQARGKLNLPRNTLPSMPSADG